MMNERTNEINSSGDSGYTWFGGFIFRPADPTNSALVFRVLYGVEWSGWGSYTRCLGGFIANLSCLNVMYGWSERLLFASYVFGLIVTSIPSPILGLGGWVGLLCFFFMLDAMRCLALRCVALRVVYAGLLD